MEDNDIAAILAKKKALLLAAAGGGDSNSMPNSLANAASTDASGSSSDVGKSASLSKAALRRQRQREVEKLKKQVLTGAIQGAGDLLPELMAKKEAKRLEIAAIESGGDAGSSNDTTVLLNSQIGKAAGALKMGEGNEEEEQEDEQEDEQEEEEEEEDFEGDDDENGRDQSMMRDASGRLLTRRERKIAKRISIAALKQLAERPDLVEAHDCCAKDPLTLVYLKSFPNTVAVPTNWSQKRKYLIAKKGYEKPPFKLPKHIEDTGITQLRGPNAGEGSETDKLKKQMRERARPKMHRMEISYETLWNAFFVHATKPEMTSIGEVYYEGREYDLSTQKRTPGKMSSALLRALGMSEDPNAPPTPPPWLAAMQVHGPPPAYPKLRIPGLNAPLPPGARWGTGEGEWGRPAVDITGRPLWGDLFGTNQQTEPTIASLGGYWGQVKGGLGGLEGQGEGEDEEREDDVREVDEGEEEEEEEENGETKEAADGKTKGKKGGAAGDSDDEDEDEDDSGTRSTLASGMMTPDAVQLRRGAAAAQGAPKQLYTVLDERATTVGSGRFGSTHVYTLPGAAGGGANVPTNVEISLTPEELEGLDAETLKRKYQSHIEAAKRASELDKAEKQRDWEEAAAAAGGSAGAQVGHKRKADGDARSTGDKNKKLNIF